MESKKVSVIIPVYNAEKHLKQCLDSIINQSLKEIEILCVNDGSTDNSQQILEKYAKKDDRIELINKKNTGSGAARKTGLHNAKGEFIAFVDSDDWVKLDTFEKLYKNAISNNSDVVLHNIMLYDESSLEYTVWQGFHGFNMATYFDENIDFNNFIFDYTYIKPLLLNGFTGCTNKLYKIEFLKSYDDFYFPKSISIGEDVPFNVQVLLKACRISFCRENFYIYRTSNINSICNSSINSKKIFDIFTIIDKVEDILIENKILYDYKNEFYKFQIDHLTHWFYKCDKIFKEEFFEIIKQYFEKINFDDHEINKLNLHSKNIYLNILNSNTYREFKLLERIRFLELNYEKNLRYQKEAYEKKIELKKQIIKGMNSSKSWKLTKPLRKIGIGIKRFKK